MGQLSLIAAIDLHRNDFGRDAGFQKTVANIFACHLVKRMGPHRSQARRLTGERSYRQHS